MASKVVIAGGSGLIGRALTRRLLALGRDVVILGRGPAAVPTGARLVPWDGRSVGPWRTELDGAGALVNLAGRSINSAPTAENRRDILASRIDAVRVLGEALRACAHPPACWVQASAVGYYGTHSSAIHDETDPPGSDFLAGVCRTWEEAHARALPAGVRPVILRIGVVLGNEGGAFPPLLRLAQCGLGGAAGSGAQGLSWIHLQDLEEILLRSLADAGLQGPCNACAPQPVSNADFMRTLRQTLRRPWAPPAPARLLRPVARYLLRTDPDLILTGQFARPARLEAAGFKFRFGGLRTALAHLTGRTAAAA